MTQPTTAEGRLLVSLQLLWTAACCCQRSSAHHAHLISVDCHLIFDSMLVALAAVCLQAEPPAADASFASLMDDEDYDEFEDEFLDEEEGEQQAAGI
jgi:hypothetical protein